jgi:tryptophan synthase alpha chain
MSAEHLGESTMTGIERIANAFRPHQTAFMPYMMLGYPTPETSLQVVQTLVSAGADLLELGVPFSDPLADGPTIQAAAQRALENGVTLTECITMVAELRNREVMTPVLLMSYVNPILAYGVQRFAADSAVVGVDGFIVPDLPPEEADDLENACRQYNLALVYLLAPTSPPERCALVAEKSQGFIYLVSLTGVTGARDALPPGLADFVARVRAVADKPLAVGFGIGSGEQARTVAQLADGVIVGSALVRRAGESMDQVRALAVELRQALNGSGVQTFS